MRTCTALFVGLFAALAPNRPLLPAETDFATRVKQAPVLPTEDLGEPVRSVREGMLLSVPNPDGKSWDLLQVYFPEYGGPNTIVIVDLGSGEIQQVQTERGWNFHLCPSVVAPNGKLFISILDRRLRQRICLYDPAANRFTLDAVKMPEEILGETHPLVLGTNGKLYAIGQHTSKAATAVEIDPESLAVTAYGPIGPSHAPNSCWGYSGGADDRFIYIASGKIPWYLVAFDRQTRTSHTVAQTETVAGMVSVGQQHDGCTAQVLPGARAAQTSYWLHEGKAVPRTAGTSQVPPWPARNAPRKLPPRPEINTSRAVPDPEGWAELWVRPETKSRAAAAPAKAAPVKATPESAPEASDWKRFRYRVPIYPHSIYRLCELADGRLLGTAGSYEGNFVYDPASGRAKHLGKCHLSHYATALLDGKVYMSGYPTSPLYVLDPAKPWTAGTVVRDRVIQDTDPQANPRQLLLLGEKKLAGTHKMYGAATGADGKVYFGGQWIRDGACGGLAWYDPSTGQAGGLWQPLSNYQVTHLAAADGGKIIVVSTRRIDDHVLNKPKPEQGALFFFDTTQGALGEPFEPAKGVKGTGPVVSVEPGRILGWTEDPNGDKQSQLYCVDVRARKLVFLRTLPVPLPVAIGSNQQEAWDFRMGPDGMVWTFAAGALLRIDASDGSVHPVGRLAPGGRIAFADGNLYLGGTTALRRIRDFKVTGKPH